MSASTQTTSSQARFPPELILHVVSHLDPDSARTSLIGVNRLLTDEVERITYRDVDLTKLRPPRRRAGFLAALDRDARRGAYLRSLTLSADLNGLQSLVVFQSFVNLRSLTIELPTATPSADGLKRCRFPRLRSLRATWSLNDPSFRQFLAHHPHLTSLHLRKSHSLSFGMPTAFPGPESILPRLEDLQGHWSNVVRLVEGRPVISVVVSSANAGAYLGRHKLRGVLPRVARSASAMGVEKLTIHVRKQDVDGELVRLVAGHVRGLRTLHLAYSEFGPDMHVRGDVEVSDNQGNRVAVDGLDLRMDAAVQEEIAHALDEFDQLQALGIAVGATTKFRRRDPGDLDLLTPTVLLACAPLALRRVVLADQAWVRAVDGEEWIRMEEDAI